MGVSREELAARTLAIVPARGGSRGIPGKNLRRLAGRPLLAYTLGAARAAGIERVILSSEDEEILAVGRRLGYSVPFVRPAELALDETPTLPVLQHALAALDEQGALESVDFVCLLQPTSPLRPPKLILDCLRALVEAEADAVCSVLPVPAEHNPHWVYRQAEDGCLRLFSGDSEPIARRQDLPPVVHREGSVYLVRRDAFERTGSLYGERLMGVEVDAATSVNLDSVADWERAEELLRQRPALGGHAAD